MKKVAALVLAGNKKIRKELRRKKRRGFYQRLKNPRLWLSGKEQIESSIASAINRDDYIIGENKSLLYLHPDLIGQENINYLKRVLYFAGKTRDRVFSKNKADLLDFLSGDGITSISLVVQALKGSNRIDQDRILIIGPGKQIRKELKRRSITGVKVIEQGESLGENMIKGSRELEADGYENDHILMIGGDVPLATSSSIDEMIDFIEHRGGDPDIFYGVGSRQEVGSFIMEHGLENMGRVGPNYPRKGNLNKFGFPIIDDIPIFKKKGERTHMMIGNVFIYRRSSLNMEFINKFYRLRKMAANPFTYPYIIYKFGAPMFRAVRWKMTVTDAERTFARATGVKISLFPVHPEIALDLDSYSDLRRLSALHFHRLGTDKDLEMVLKDFIKKKGSRRKRRRGK